MVSFRCSTVENGRVATLTEVSHAYRRVHCPNREEGGYRGLKSGPNGGHDEFFGTMLLAVNARALKVICLEGDLEFYPLVRDMDKLKFGPLC